MQIGSIDFSEVVVADFEFASLPGEQVQPLCLVAWELCSGRVHRLFGDELRSRPTSPYHTDQGTLFVAFFASAEVNCHLALNWPIPVSILDLYVEFRNITNGLSPPNGNGLLGASIFYGLDVMDAAEKDLMRKLVLRGGPYTADEAKALMEYCEMDVTATRNLFQRMISAIDVSRAVLRGRFMGATARIETCGIPVDKAALDSLSQNWNEIQLQLIRKADASYGVYQGATFRTDLFEQYLAVNEIPWTRLESGRLALDDETFSDMVQAYPSLRLLRELRSTLGQMRMGTPAVGSDRRNRWMLSPFSSKTGRNQPSSRDFIFARASWNRGFIRPEPGFALAYLDWSQQEFGIAAALSDDGNMIAAYNSGDPYLGTAKQTGAVPLDATKQSHGEIRDLYKKVVLGVQYSMGEEGLARRIGKSLAHARELLQMHRKTYRRFWKWSDDALQYAMIHNSLYTTFGWTIHGGPDTNPRTLRNFLMQGNGAEMLRLACCLATERGIAVCAPVHDAVLIEAPLDGIDHAVLEAQEAMADASAVVLDGFRLRTDARVIRYPDCLVEERGMHMWKLVWETLSELKLESGFPWSR